MTAPNYVPGKGATLTNGSTVVVHVSEISYSPEVKTQETTNLSSAAAESFATIVDNGEISANIFYDSKNSAHTALTTMMTTIPATPPSWTITDSQASTFIVSGWLTGFDVSGITADDVVRAAIKIRTTGAGVWTEGS